MPLTVVPLVASSSIPVPVRPNQVWMSWEAARYEGLRIPRHIKRWVGPRRRGTVYRNGFWGQLSTVHQVFLQVGDVTHRGRTVKTAVWFEIVEQSQQDLEWRVRRHSSTWDADSPGSKDEALFMIDTIEAGDE